MWNWIVNKLVERAKRTPYFNLTDYMNRWWLVPYANVVERTVDYGNGYSLTQTDGTGPVTWRRPVARIIQLLGLGVRIHEILRSDYGRDPHNHPWPFLSIILRGEYVESRYDDKGSLISVRKHGPGSVLYRPANSWHRLDVPLGLPVTTLFITGAKVQRWGFNVDGQFIPYTEYKGRQ